MIGLDTNALIDFSFGDKSVTEIMGKFTQLCICDPVYLEFLCGKDAKKWIMHFSSEVDFFQTNPQILEKTSEIFRELREKGLQTSIFDCWIAASYLENGVTKILTKNVKHFENISGLITISY